MKAKRIFAAAAICALAMGMLPARAETETRTYVALVATAVNVPNVATGVGGYKFPTHDARYTSLTIVDAGGATGIDVVVCTNACDAELGTQHGYCTDDSGGISLADQGNVAGDTLTAYISVTSTGLFYEEQDCPGVATTGTVSANY